MANLKISDMTPGAALDGTELFECVQSANTVSVTGDQIAQFASQRTLQYNVPIAAFSLTVNAQVLILEPAGTLATGEIILPASPADGDEVCITSTQIVTALTLTPGAGQSVATALTALAAGVPVAMVYRSANTKWYRVA